jgi:hypothetical protein
MLIITNYTHVPDCFHSNITCKNELQLHKILLPEILKLTLATVCCPVICQMLLDTLDKWKVTLTKIQQGGYCSSFTNVLELRHDYFR